MADVEDLIAAITNNTATRTPPKPPKKAPKARTKPYKPRRPRTYKQRLAWVEDPVLRRKHQAKWGRLRWIERTLVTRKDAAIVAMIDDGLTWNQICKLTGISEAAVARALRRVRGPGQGTKGPKPRS